MIHFNSQETITCHSSVTVGVLTVVFLVIYLPVIFATGSTYNYSQVIGNCGVLSFWLFWLQLAFLNSEVVWRQEEQFITSGTFEVMKVKSHSLGKYFNQIISFIIAKTNYFPF